MKQISTIISAFIMLFMVSCNNQPKPVEEATAPTPAKPAFTPYKAMLITHTVKDFDTWYAAFNGDTAARNAAGLTESSVGRGLDDNNMVVVFATASDIQKAKDFSASPALKETMTKAGVTSAPAVSYWNVLRDDTSKIPQMERLMVTHHVKDFDTWLKAYDGEGMATRAANGLVDRAMARGLDDPNTVTLLFAVTDMDKAKARVNSPELKKIMTDGGVDGPPQMTYFKWVKM